jgi:hypothetical protein
VGRRQLEGDAVSIFFCMKRKIVLFSISIYLVKVEMLILRIFLGILYDGRDITFLYSFKNNNALLRASVCLDGTLPSPRRSLPSSPATLASTVLTRRGHHTSSIMAFL